jgi:hypothetical protein
MEKYIALLIKKSLFVSYLGLLIMFSSCKRDYECFCNTTADPDPEKTYIEIIHNTTRKGAERKCANVFDNDTIKYSRCSVFQIIKSTQ